LMKTKDSGVLSLISKITIFLKRILWIHSSGSTPRRNI